VKKIKNRFSGDVFLYENSTRTNFISNAPQSKILHIGTHAESNNLSPELSRLLFAKDLEMYQEVDENSLYAYQIYNYDFTSDLAILTACETGKPEYQPGEGMISLAHAFNYAGSESMLTSLWQIDEQASATIVETFYTYLADGYSKPEALQKAKLAYLTKAEGRTVSPNYWAGLIIMGDPSPVFLETNSVSWFWLLLLLLLIAGIYTITKYRKIRH
jgi:CHAT domain-containing protein